MSEGITGIVLAGGQGRRFGGVDKGMLQLHGKPLVEYTIDALRPQTDSLIISANRNLDFYARYNIPVIGDDRQCQGPLAGIASTLVIITTDYALTAPCDSPFLPADLASRLLTSLKQHDVDLAVVHDGQRLQPLFLLLKKTLHASLLLYLEKDRKVDLWVTAQSHVVSDFSDQTAAFVNINTVLDYELAENFYTDKR